MLLMIAEALSGRNCLGCVGAHEPRLQPLECGGRQASTVSVDASFSPSHHSFAEQALQAYSTRALPEFQGDLTNHPPDWTGIFELAKSRDDIRRLLIGIVLEAEKTLELGPEYYRRPIRFEEIPKSFVDPISLRQGENRDARALAMSDVTQADFLRSKVVGLAFAYRYTRQDRFLQKLLEILQEVKKYRPLQRPGWSLTEPQFRLPPEGDGVNMATSWGMVGIADILELVGTDLPAELKSAMEEILRDEVGRVAKSWAQRIPWFTKGAGSPSSNQWIDPNVGVVRACLILGDVELLPAYNMATENLAKSLSYMGADGAYLEGVTYAQMTTPALFDSIQRIRRIGDHRFDGFSSLRESWKWWIHMLLPGGRFVNCYDSRMGRLPSWSIRSPLSAMIEAAFVSSDPRAIGNLYAIFPEGNATLAGVRYATARPVDSNLKQIDLPTYAHFQSQEVIVWRSRFSAPTDAAPILAVWVRGGTSHDSHVQRDQGQVSVYVGERVVLMDCGTPDYSDQQMNSHFASAAGHGIMQVGELSPRSIAVAAPLKINRLDESGGDVELDLAKVYIGVPRYQRAIAWSRSGTVSIRDEIEFVDPIAAGTELLRFHTGAQRPVKIETSERGWKVSWPGCTMQITGSFTMEVSQLEWPDRVLDAERHQVIIIRTATAASRFEMHADFQVDCSDAWSTTGIAVQP